MTPGKELTLDYPAEPVLEIFFSDNMLEKFNNLRIEFGPKSAADKMLGEHDIDQEYMKSQAIRYYVHGPAWRVDDYLLDRAWIKGYEAACQKAGYQLAGQPYYKITFAIDRFCYSKLDKPLPEQDQ